MESQDRIGFLSCYLKSLFINRDWHMLDIFISYHISYFYAFMVLYTKLFNKKN